MDKEVLYYNKLAVSQNYGCAISTKLSFENDIFTCKVQNLLIIKLLLPELNNKFRCI